MHYHVLLALVLAAAATASKTPEVNGPAFTYRHSVGNLAGNVADKATMWGGQKGQPKPVKVEAPIPEAMPFGPGHTATVFGAPSGPHPNPSPIPMSSSLPFGAPSTLFEAPQTPPHSTLFIPSQGAPSFGAPQPFPSAPHGPNSATLPETNPFAQSSGAPRGSRTLKLRTSKALQQPPSTVPLSTFSLNAQQFAQEHGLPDPTRMSSGKKTPQLFTDMPPLTFSTSSPDRGVPLSTFKPTKRLPTHVEGSEGIGVLQGQYSGSSSDESFSASSSQQYPSGSSSGKQPSKNQWTWGVTNTGAFRAATEAIKHARHFFLTSPHLAWNTGFKYQRVLKTLQRDYDQAAHLREEAAQLMQKLSGEQYAAVRLRLVRVDADLSAMHTVLKHPIPDYGDVIEGFGDVLQAAAVKAEDAKDSVVRGTKQAVDVVQDVTGQAVRGARIAAEATVTALNNFGKGVETQTKKMVAPVRDWWTYFNEMWIPHRVPVQEDELHRRVNEAQRFVEEQQKFQGSTEEDLVDA